MAGRSVGQISVTVDADTGRLKAQLTKAGTEAGRAAKRAIEAELKGIEAEVEVKVDQASLRAAVARIESGLRGIEAEIGAQLDQTSVERVGEEINAILDVEVHDQGITVATDETSIVRAGQRINTMLGALVRDVQVGVDVSDADVLAAGAKIDQLLGAGAGGGGGWGGAGQKAGGSFGGAFVKTLGATVAVLAQPITVALQGALAASTSIISSAFSGLAGGAGAATPIVAGLGAELGAIVVGSQGMGDALGAVSDEFKAATVEGREFNIAADDITEAFAVLSPAAQDFATAFAEIQPALHDLQTEVSERLFAGLDDALRELSTTAIPSISDALGLAADSANDFFRDLAGLAGEIDFAGIFEALQPALDTFGDAIIQVLGLIEPFLTAAAPAAKLLADSLSAGATHLGDMVTAGAASGELSAFLVAGVESLKLWGDLLVSVGDALFTLFEAGKASGDSFVENLTGIIDRFDEWMESVEGQQALREFFETGRQIMEDLVPVLKGLQGFFANLVTPEAVGRFGQFTDALGRALPFLGELLDLVGRVGIDSALVEVFARIGEALEPVMPQLGELADVLGTALRDAIKAVTPVLPALASLFGELAEALTPAMQTSLEAMVDLFAAAAPIVADLIELLEPFAENLTGLAIGFEVATPFMEAATEALKLFGPVLEFVTPLLETFTSTLGFLAQVQGNAPTGDEGWIGWLKQIPGPVGTGAKAFDFFRDRVVDDSEDIEGAAGVIKGAIDLAMEPPARPPQGLGQLAEGSESAIYAMERMREEAETTFTMTDRQIGGLATMFGDIPDPVDRAAEAIEGLKDKASKAAEAADDLRESWELLFGSGKDLVSATADYEQALADLDVQVRGGAEAQRLREEAFSKATQANEEAADAADELAAATTKGEREAAQAHAERATELRDESGALLEQADALTQANRTLDLHTQAGRDNAAALIEGRDALLTRVEALKADGATGERITRVYDQQRTALITQATQFGLTRKEATKYVDNLGLIPSEKATEILTPGLGTADQGVRDYKKFALDSIDSEISTKIKANVDTTELVTLSETINALDGTTIEIFTTASGTRMFGGGGQARPGFVNVAGEAGAELTRYGSLRGLVSRPTLVPPGTMVTSAALTGAILRSLPTGGSGRTFNVVNNITPLAADPSAVATQVVNRMAVLAAR